jgi:hypothetical protein
VIDGSHDLWVTPGPRPGGTRFLTLGYEDQRGDYGDNGYNDHDDGTGNQCATRINAYVLLAVEDHPRNPPNPWPPPISEPHIQYFTADPNNGLIRVGEAATLHWQISDCDGCDIRIQGKEGLGNVVLNVSGLSPSGSFSVVPHFNTTYTLTATTPDGYTISREKRVQLTA